MQQEVSAIQVRACIDGSSGNFTAILSGGIPVSPDPARRSSSQRLYCYQHTGLLYRKADICLSARTRLRKAQPYVIWIKSVSGPNLV